VHAQLGIGTELKHWRFHPLRQQVIPRCCLPREEERRTVDDIAQIRAEMAGRQLRGLRLNLRQRPPSGSRPSPIPEIGSVLTPKTPTGFPVAFWKAIACELDGNPELEPLRYKSASSQALASAGVDGL